MFKLAAILAFITITSAKLTQAPDFWFLEYFNEVEEPSLVRTKVSEPSKDLWVLNLDLDGFSPLRLTPANEEQEDDFNAVVGPMIESYKNRQNTQRATTDVPSRRVEKSFPKTRIVKEQIRAIVNKFVLSFEDRGSHLPGSDEQHSSNPLALYFKGPFTSLVVLSGNKQWHYFIGPPSPFPNWFYREHTDIVNNEQGKFVVVPPVLKIEFYLALLNLLGTLFSFPV